MPVSAVELRPRTAIAMFDAAIRLCARQSGIWALTLPGGAAVTGAAIAFGDALREQRDGWAPALWLTGAWFFRGLCQGAACHFVEQQLVGQAEPTVTSSALAALRRLPSLFVAVMVLASVNALTIGATFGLGFFFFSAHFAGYAATMQGKGHPLALYVTCTKLLGAARGTATRLRVCLLAQLLLMLNVHLAANLGLELAQTLIGLDLTFAGRYASADNPAWLLAVAAFSFALVEPIRATLAALLLLDGRVRQEGLDLLAAVEQLPAPKGRARAAGLGAAARAGAVLLAACAALWSAPATAGGRVTRSPQARIQRIVRDCALELDELEQRLPALDRVEDSQRPALHRFLDHLESLVDEEEDCDAAAALLENGLGEIDAAARPPGDEAQAATAADRARAILQRPEFQEPPPKRPKAEEPDPARDGEDSAWRRFWEWLGRVLEALFRPRERARGPDFGVGGPATGTAFSGMTNIAIAAGVLVLIAVILLRWKRSAPAGDAPSGLEVVAAGEEQAGLQESALSRPPEGWASLADQLAARGDYREAVRHLYLAALSRLHREGALDYDPALSNWDHVRRFKGPLPWKPPFRELTVRFDFVFYGNVGGTLDGYREFRALSRPLLEAAAPEATA